MSGFALIQRNLLGHALFEGDAARLGSWAWLFTKAAWRDVDHQIKGESIVLNRGQLCVSVRQLAEAWGMSKSAVARWLEKLEQEGMIERDAGHGKLIITICNYEEYQMPLRDGWDSNSPHSSKRDSSGTQTGTKAGHKPGQQKDTANPQETLAFEGCDDVLRDSKDGQGGTDENEKRDTKENNKTIIREDNPPNPLSHIREKDWPEIPDWIPVKPWNGFIAMRRKMKKPPTAYAVELMIKDLDKLSKEGHRPEDVLNQSAKANWQGLFPVKQQRSEQNGGSQAAGPNGSGNGDGFTRALARRGGFGHRPQHAGQADGPSHEDFGGNLQQSTKQLEGD